MLRLGLDAGVKNHWAVGLHGVTGVGEAVDHLDAPEDGGGDDGDVLLVMVTAGDALGADNLGGWDSCIFITENGKPSTILLRLKKSKTI